MTTIRPALLVGAAACSDDHRHDDGCAFRVAWTINPHMRPGAADPRRALRQHAHLRAALLAGGADVVCVPFLRGRYDSVFVKDTAVLATHHGARRALLAHPRFPERHAEQGDRARDLQAAGFAVADAPRAHLEGGDVVVLPGGSGALLGVGPRTDEDAAGDVQDFLGLPVTTLRLLDDVFFHLDTCLAALSDGTVLVVEGALSPIDESRLCRAPGVARIVYLSRAEGAAFGANLVELDARRVVIHRGARGTIALLRRLGFAPISVPLGEFLKAGGGAACLVARVHTLPSVVDAVGDDAVGDDAVGDDALRAAS